MPHPIISTLASALLLILPALATPPARAEQPANPPGVIATPTTTAPARPAPPARSLAAEDARRTLDILRDDKRRADLITTLEAIAAAGTTAPQTGAIQPATQPASAAPPNATTQKGGVPAEAPPAERGLQLAPDSLGARMLLGAESVLDQVAMQMRDTVFAVGDLPWLGRWIYSAFTDPLMQGWILGALWRLAVVLAIAIGVGWLVQRSLRHAHAVWRQRAEAVANAVAHEAAQEGLARAELGELEAPPETFGKASGEASGEAAPEPPRGHAPLARRLPLALARLGLEVAPVLAFLLTAHLVTATPLGGSRLTQLVMIAMVQALAAWRAANAAAIALAAPESAAARLLPISDETAAWLRGWTSRIAGLGLFSAATLHGALLLGLPRPAHSGWLRIASFACALCVVIMIIQRRAAVAAWLRGHARETGGFAGLRHMLAPVWHWLAIVYVITVWLIWATDLGLEQTSLLPALIATLALLVGMRIVTEAIIRTVERHLKPTAAMTERYPGIESRARGYRPLLRAAISLAVLVAGLLLLGEIWGFAPLLWLTTSRTGRDLLAGASTIGITLLLALGVWEGVNLALARHVARLAEFQAARAARLRTLLPMLRTALMITIVIVVGLTVLSQIGINIAPLLAGAGVLGLAIGIGSQKLVQDLITGLFLLLENAMQVGDVVTVAGVTGVVEDLSIRSIRLRTEDGSVQIIPFSAVTGVTNMTRDFSQAVIETQVSYDEDYEKVATALAEIAADMRAEPLWQTDIQGDLDVMGMVKMDAGAMVVKSRIKCGPFARWKVQRELYRRIKEGFTARGIILPSTRQTLVLENPPAERRGAA